MNESGIFQRSESTFICSSEFLFWGIVSAQVITSMAGFSLVITNQLVCFHLSARIYFMENVVFCFLKWRICQICQVYWFSFSPSSASAPKQRVLLLPPTKRYSSLLWYIFLWKCFNCVRFFTHSYISFKLFWFYMKHLDSPPSHTVTSVCFAYSVLIPGFSISVAD